RLGAWVLDVISGALLAAIAGGGVTSIVAATGGIGSPDDASSWFTAVVFVVFSLYLAFGWMRGETLGTLLLRLRILRAADRSGCGLFRAFLRGFGELVTLVIGLAVFQVGIFIDNQLYFIQGTPDAILRIAIGLLALYAIWLGSGQLIVAGGRRQTLADKIAGTIVTVRP
ncbi:MAG TPA: RDD family protein, partial [Chloroflexota bacterium]